MKQKMYFIKFTKKYWWLLTGLLLLLVIPVFIYCRVFWGQLNDSSAWASIIAGIATYLGSAFLGIVVYYNSWVQIEQQELNENLKIDVRLCADLKDGYFVPYSEDQIETDSPYRSQSFEKQTSSEEMPANYLSFELANHNPYVSFYFSVAAVYYVNEMNQLSKIDRFKLNASRDPNINLDYKENIRCYLGCSSDLLKRDYYTQQKYNNWFVILKIRTQKNKTKYLILDYVLGQTLGVFKYYLDEKTFNKHMKENGCPIRLTNYNRQFFKKTK